MSRESKEAEERGEDVVCSRSLVVSSERGVQLSVWGARARRSTRWPPLAGWPCGSALCARHRRELGTVTRRARATTARGLRPAAPGRRRLAQTTG